MKVHERRERLLLLGVDFVRSIRGLEGVERIALIGSLCTAKPEPKDIDFLLRLRPGLDLKKLAKSARRLQSLSMQMGSGADIFLHEEGRYIGRICGYRECFPRVRCLADHCTLRPHLNDDLRNLTLEDRWMADPPLIVWPEWKAEPGVPADTLDLLRRSVETPSS
jgi:hypothetical protein